MPDTEPSPDDRPIDLHNEGLVDRIAELEAETASGIRDFMISEGASSDDADTYLEFAAFGASDEELRDMAERITGRSYPDPEADTPSSN